MKREHKGAFALLLAGFMYALQAIFPKYLSSFLGPYETITLRFLVAFIIVGMIVIITKKKISFNYSNTHKKNLVVYALAFPVSAVLFTLAVFYTKVSLAIFSFYIANVVSSFIVGYLFLGERFTVNRTVALVLSLLALVCFTNPFVGFSVDIGFLIGLFSGIVQTVAVINQKKVSVGSATNLVVFQTAVSTIVGILIILVTKSSIHITNLPPLGILISVLYGASFAAVSYLMVYGFRNAKLSIGTVMVSSELFFGPLLAFFIFAEHLSVLQLLGGFFTILAIVFASRSSEN